MFMIFSQIMQTINILFLYFLTEVAMWHAGAHQQYYTYGFHLCVSPIINLSQPQIVNYLFDRQMIELFVT